MKKSISIPDSLYDAFVQVYGEQDFSGTVQTMMKIMLNRDGYELRYQPERYDLVKKSTPIEETRKVYN